LARPRLFRLAFMEKVVYTFGYTMMHSKIARYGNSLTVRLPAVLARELEFRDGDRVILHRTEHGVAVERVPGSRLTAWLQTVHEPEPEFGALTAVGREVIE
jgi:antitoxin component of MazEF toxin-antitoxin module